MSRAGGPPPASAPVPGAEPACRIGTRDVSRSFGRVAANTDVTLTVRPGTVHAVVGENGAGKSTLMRMLYGLDRPDAGTIVVDDSEVRFSGPREAMRHRIGLVQQELAVIPELRLLDNLILGQEPSRAGRIDWRLARERADRLADDVGVQIDWLSDAAHAPVSVQQQVEILRLIYRGATVLILDEPTAVLAPAQVAELLRLLRSLAEQGHTIVFISHKLDEVLEVSDEITVLRAGRIVGHAFRGDIDRAGLARMIVGAEVDAVESVERGPVGDVALRVENLAVPDDRGIPRVRDVSLEVRSGEIVGVAAVAGNGQDELAEAIIGVRTLSGGALRIDGLESTRATPRQRRRRGLAYVSADRKHEGLAADLSVAENLVALPSLAERGRLGWLSPGRVERYARQALTAASVRFGKVSDPVSSLSGGNQQRLVMERELSQGTKILVASQPTRGVDLRGIAHIHGLLRTARAQGTAILLFSEELEELIALADRVVVLHSGTVSGVLQSPTTKEAMGALMLGGQEAAA